MNEFWLTETSNRTISIVKVKTDEKGRLEKSRPVSLKCKLGHIKPSPWQTFDEWKKLVKDENPKALVKRLEEKEEPISFLFWNNRCSKGENLNRTHYHLLHKMIGGEK